MTCIVGIEHEGTVYMGGDSAMTAGWALTLTAHGKLFQRGPYLVGTCGSPRMGQLIQYRLPIDNRTPPRPSLEKCDEFMATTFIENVRKCLKDGGFAGKENEREEGGEFLVGFQGHLYEINSDYQARRSLAPYNAVGSGEEIAKGALHATSHLPPRERLQCALVAAEAHNAAVRGPFTFLEAK